MGIGVRLGEMHKGTMIRETPGARQEAGLRSGPDDLFE